MKSNRRIKLSNVVDGCSQSDKYDNLPRGYPGAKLARRAVFKGIAVKHPRGLRVDGLTV